MKMTLEYTVEVTEKCNYIFSVNAQTMEIIEFKGVHCWVDDYQVSFTMNPGTGGGGGFAPTDNVTGPFGGGSGQNDDGDKDNQYIDADPCAMARNMNNNAQGFKDRVNTMHGEVSPHNTDFASTENGWVRTSDGRIYTPCREATESPEIQLEHDGRQFDGMVPHASHGSDAAQHFRFACLGATVPERTHYGCGKLFLRSDFLLWLCFAGDYFGGCFPEVCGEDKDGGGGGKR